MKRVITAFVMLALSVIGIAVISIVLEKKFEQTDKKISFLYENIDQQSVTDTKAQIDSLNEEWKKTEKILKFVSIHEKIDPISDNMSLLKKSAEIPDKKEMKKLCIQIKLQLEMLYISEKPFVENIF